MRNKREREERGNEEERRRVGRGLAHRMGETRGAAQKLLNLIRLCRIAAIREVRVERERIGYERGWERKEDREVDFTWGLVVAPLRERRYEFRNWRRYLRVSMAYDVCRTLSLPFSLSPMQFRYHASAGPISY